MSSRGHLILIAALLFVLSIAHTADAQPFLYGAPNTTSASGNHVYVFNAATLNMVAQIGLPAGHVATDLALGVQDRVLYVTTSASNSGGVVVVDTLANTIVRTINFPQPAWSVTVSHDRQHVYVGRDPSTLTVLRASDLSVETEVTVGAQPADIALMPDDSALYVLNRQSGNLSVLTLPALTTAATIPVGSSPQHVAIGPDGGEAVVSNGVAGTISIIDTSSRTVTQTVTVPSEGTAPFSVPRISGLGFSPDGAKLYIGDTSFNTLGTSHVRVMITATRAITATGPANAAHDVAIDPNANRAYVFGTIGKFGQSAITALDMATDQAAGTSESFASGGGAIAIGNPAGCAFEITPKLAQWGPGGGAGTIAVPAPDGCSWTVAASAPWLTTNVTSGSGAGTVTYAVAANGGEPRSATLTIAGQSVLVRQTLPQVWIDEPTNGSTANAPIVLRGWAIDRDDTQTEDRYGTGIDAVNVYAYPASGGAAIFVGTASPQPRSDISAAYGFKYAWAGFTINVRGLPAGAYTLVAFAHSARTGNFTAALVNVTLTINSSPAGFVEAPRQTDEVTQPFLVAGWAADLARASGTGVDAVNVYAYPASGGAPLFVGSAQYGSWPRPDVANFYQDSSLTPSGYLMLVSGLAVGRYTLVAYAHSTVTGQFFARTVDVNVIGSSEAIMQVDIATPNTNRTVSLIGWAADRRASSGNGISAIHVWAYPDSGASPIFVGATGAPATDRLEPRLMLGAQFANSGWGLTSSTMAAGGYRLVVYALSTVTGQFDAVRVVRVIIP
jgi:YVTN family beta-propeller protein